MDSVTSISSRDPKYNDELRRIDPHVRKGKGCSVVDISHRRDPHPNRGLGNLAADSDDGDTESDGVSIVEIDDGGSEKDGVVESAIPTGDGSFSSGSKKFGVRDIFSSDLSGKMFISDGFSFKIVGHCAGDVVLGGSTYIGAVFAMKIGKIKVVDSKLASGLNCVDVTGMLHGLQKKGVRYKRMCHISDDISRLYPLVGLGKPSGRTR